MKSLSSGPEMIKKVGAALIIGAAVFIMVPGLLNYAASIGRMALLIGATLVICIFLVSVSRLIAKKNR